MPAGIPQTVTECLEILDLQHWTHIWAMNRSGVSVERRILAGVGTAALCRDAATSRFMEKNFTPLPTALYGIVLLLAAVAYAVLQTLIVKELGGCDSPLAQSLGRDWKGKLSPVLYALAVAASFLRPWVAGCLYVFVALMWLVPDRRVARVVHE